MAEQAKDDKAIADRKKKAQESLIQACDYWDRRETDLKSRETHGNRIQYHFVIGLP